ncbi:MAG TPA: sialidase family protein [Erysipelothrix sp.]
MKNKKKIIQLVFFILFMSLVFVLGMVYSQQSKNIEKHQVNVKEPYTQENVNTSAYTWVSSYLHSYQNKYNLRQPINSFNIKIFSLEESYDDVFAYRAQIEIDTEQQNIFLFKETPVCAEHSCVYDLVLYLKREDNLLKYHDEKSYESYDEIETYWRYEGEQDENVDPLVGLYHLDKEYLEVRFSKDEKWLQTPILSSNFDIKSQGWYQNDKRLYISEDHIGIIYRDEGINLAQSFDKGEHWSTLKLIDEAELSNMSKGYINFDGDYGSISVLSYVAINSHVMTMFETTDGGISWTKGFTPNRNMHIYDSTVLDDKVYFTFNNSASLYSTNDLGETFTEVILPEGSIDHVVSWSEVFIQAEAPFKQGDRFIMLVNQGENGDYKRNVKARYISSDKGKTWVFDSLVEPEKKVEPN